MKKTVIFITLLISSVLSYAQINTEQVLRVGQNALYFEDYMLSIQYFNRVIQSKPYLAQPYFFRAIAKLNLEDYNGAEQDASTAIDLNPYLTDAWEVRGVARQNLGRNAEAITDYDHALQLVPRNRQLLFNKALAQQDCGQATEADSTFGDLLRYYPGFDAGYLGRARLRLEQADTVAAMADIDKAMSINKNAVNAYIMRADIAISRGSDFASAAADMDEAIRLQPRLAGLYVNRAYLRYKNDDFFGAMADFDYAIELDPLNEAAIFNRALLEMETSANDRALVDLDRLIDIDPSNTRAYYNRAIVNHAKGLHAQAAADITKVIEEVPELPDPYFMRSEFLYAKGDMRAAERDYNKGIALSKKVQSMAGDFDAGGISPSAGGEAAGRNREEARTDEASPSHAPEASAEAARRFATLLTIANNAEIHEEYNNTAIRGKVQDRNIHIEPESWMEIAYYSPVNELRSTTYYIKEIDDINASRILRFVIRVTPSVPSLDSESSARHFESIEYYNSYLATHEPRAIDYIGRALDFITIHDYTSAIRDIDRAIALTPDLAVAHMLRAQAAFHNFQLEDGKIPDNMPANDAMTLNTMRRKALDDVLADLSKAIELSPNMAEAWYNKAVAHLQVDDYTSALAALNRAIELKPEMGEAWYNRGYVYLRLGNNRLGIADLSRAGQLGILPAYNLLKRISN
ncbi:MAG: tetratricopeptide repeat protein [Muribaculaceae bacterium]|nr:tetratricopeptide repeat protein [Muribaculaceae bacterium]